MPRPRLRTPAGACCAMILAACAAAPAGSGAAAGPSQPQAPVPAAGAADPTMPAESVRWTIGPARVECAGVGPMWCLQYRDAPDGAWKRHFGRIEGFEFRPGDEVELLVRFEAVPRPPADAPSRRTVLVREVARRTLSSEVLPAALAGTAWRLDTMPGATVPAGSPPVVPTLRLDAAGSATGGSGVNRFGARVDAGAGWLRVASPRVTRMAGPPEAMALESEFLGRLQRAGHWRVDADRLRLLDAAGVELMSLRRVPPGPGG